MPIPEPTDTKAGTIHCVRKHNKEVKFDEDLPTDGAPTKP
jgi:hypothetical protein